MWNLLFVISEIILLAFFLQQGLFGAVKTKRNKKGNAKV